MAEIDRLSGRRAPIAEIARLVGEAAARLQLTRPSYEQVRVRVHEARSRAREPTLAEVAVDVTFRRRPPDALLDHVSGVGVPRLRP